MMKAKIWILFLFFILHGIFVNSETNPNTIDGNVNAVCQYVYNGLSAYGTRFIRYPLPQTCREYEGLGEEALKKFQLEGQSCYKSVAPNMCAFQFVDYEASAGCGDTSKLFFHILEACQTKNSLTKQYVSCATFDPKSGIIGDPEKFCTNSYLKIVEGTNDDEKLTTNKFTESELLNCKRLAESYNACTVVAVKELGYSKEYCNGNGFSAYCSKFPIVIKDSQFKIICENLVIPYIMEMNQRIGSNSDMCIDMGSRYLLYLSTKKGDWLKKSNAVKQTIESLNSEFDMMSMFQSSVKALDDDSVMLDSESTILFNMMKSLNSKNMAYDNKIIGLMQKLEAAATLTEISVGEIYYPDLQNSVDENLKEFTKVTPTIDNILPNIKNTIVVIKDLQKMLNSGGHASYSSSYGFYPITNKDFYNTQSKIKKICDNIHPFSELYQQQLSSIPVVPNQQTVLLKTEGEKFAKMAELYAAQTELLIKIQRSAVKGNNSVMKSIMGEL